MVNFFHFVVLESCEWSVWAWRSILMSSWRIDLGLPSGLYNPGFSTKKNLLLSCLPYVLCAPPFSFFLISSLKCHLVKSKDHKSPHFIIFFCPYLLHPCQSQISSSTSCSQRTSVFAPSSVWETKFHNKTKNEQNYSSLYLNLHIFI